jgi:hypothetical protein
MVAVTAVLITTAVILFTLAIRRKDLPEQAAVSPIAHLEERKATIYENLRDLQFEYRVGKLSDQDYQQTKLDLQRELAGVLAEVDRLQPATGKAAAPKPHSAVPKPEAPSVCPRCGAKFPRPMKFCGECGSPMAGGTA